MRICTNFRARIDHQRPILENIKKYNVAFSYWECQIELASVSIASYHCNDVVGKDDVCNLFLKGGNTFSLG